MLKLATKFVPRQPAFEVAYQAGFRNAELWLNAVVLAEWQAVAELARHYPLEYVLHFPNKLEQEPQTLEYAVALYRQLACRAMVIHQPHFDRYAAAIAKLDPGVNLAIENHRLSPPELELWAERSPGLTLDLEHFWKFTHGREALEFVLGALRQFLARFAGKLRHIHLPGYVPGYDEHRPMYAARELVFGVLSLLAEHEFGGLVVSEVDLEYQNPQDLRMDVLLFDRWRHQHDSYHSAPPPPL